MSADQFFEALAKLNPQLPDKLRGFPPALFGGNGLELVLARWWFVPGGWKAPFRAFVKKAATFNARVETAHELPTFANAFVHRRCLIPTQGWFEYTGEGKKKDRWLIAPASGDALTLAGPWSRFNDPEVGPTYTFTMVMQPAFEQVKHIHHRAPIPLHAEQCENWLHGTTAIDAVLTASHRVPLNVAEG